MFDEILFENHSTQISFENCDATLSFHVNSNKFEETIRKILGYSEPLNTKMRRIPPVNHPYIPNLFAKSISISPKGLKKIPLDGVKDLGQNAPAKLKEFVAKEKRKNNIEETGLKKSTTLFGNDNSTPIVPETTNYSDYIFTVNFASFPTIRFLTDQEVSMFYEGYLESEALRFTKMTFLPKVEALQADNMSNLIFTEGEPISSNGPLNQIFPVPMATYLKKATFIIEWFWVPHNFISSNEYYLFPPAFYEALGCYNSKKFLDFEAGTLLFEGFEAEPCIYFKNFNAINNYDAQSWNIKFTFQYFEPEKGVPNSEYRGHRIYPWRNDLKFYHARVGKWIDGGKTFTATTEELLKGYDFRKMFIYWPYYNQNFS